MPGGEAGARAGRSVRENDVFGVSEPDVVQNLSLVQDIHIDHVVPAVDVLLRLEIGLQDLGAVHVLRALFFDIVHLDHHRGSVYVHNFRSAEQLVRILARTNQHPAIHSGYHPSGGCSRVASISQHGTLNPHSLSPQPCAPDASPR